MTVIWFEKWPNEISASTLHKHRQSKLLQGIKKKACPRWKRMIYEQKINLFQNWEGSLMKEFFIFQNISQCILSCFSSTPIWFGKNIFPHFGQIFFFFFYLRCLLCISSQLPLGWIPLGWIQERCGAYRQFQPPKSITCSSENYFSPVLRTDLNLNIWEETNSLFLLYPHDVLSDRWVSGGHMDDYRWLNPQQHDYTPTVFPRPSRHRHNMEKQLHLQHWRDT